MKETTKNQKLFITVRARKGNKKFGAMVFWNPQIQKYKIILSQARQMIEALVRKLVKEQMITKE
jgi:hypothetical protein